jgi:hypothetical protein
MGGSSGGSSSGGGGGGGGNDKKKATPKATPVRARNNKQKARKAKTTPKAPKINYGGNGNNNQRANLPSEVSKPVRPATPIKSTAKTTPVATAKITKDEKQGNIPEAVGRSNRSISEVAISPSMKMGVDQPSLLSVKPVDAAPKAKLLSQYNSVNTTKPVNPQDPKLLSEMGIGVDTSKAVEPVAKALKPVEATTPTAKVNPFGGAAMASIMSDSDPATRNKSLLQGYQNTLTSRDNFDKSVYDKEADVGRDSLIRGDKYRNDNSDVSYNQAYWMARRAGGATDDEIKAERDAIGMKKAYSGDRVINQQDQEKSKYILDVLGKAGIKPTVTSKTSGFFDERNTTTNSYDIGTGKPITTTTQNYSPKIGGVSFGDDVTKTFVNGVAVFTKTGDGAVKDSKLGSLKQRSQSSPDPIKEMKDIDNQIKTETDPVILKALHKRRLMLMRMNRTNTRFAGLLGEADTKRTNLMSIS